MTAAMALLFELFNRVYSVFQVVPVDASEQVFFQFCRRIVVRQITGVKLLARNHQTCINRQNVPFTAKHIDVVEFRNVFLRYRIAAQRQAGGRSLVETGFSEYLQGPATKCAVAPNSPDQAVLHRRNSGLETDQKTRLQFEERFGQRTGSLNTAVAEYPLNPRVVSKNVGFRENGEADTAICQISRKL